MFHKNKIFEVLKQEMLEQINLYKIGLNEKSYISSPVLFENIQDRPSHTISIACNLLKKDLITQDQYKELYDIHMEFINFTLNSRWVYEFDKKVMLGC